MFSSHAADNYTKQTKELIFMWYVLLFSSPPSSFLLLDLPVELLGSNFNILLILQCIPAKNIIPEFI